MGVRHALGPERLGPSDLPPQAVTVTPKDGPYEYTEMTIYCSL